MAPKKDLAALKAEEVTLAAQALGKRKRPTTVVAEDQKLLRLRRGLHKDPAVVTGRVKTAAPQPVPTRDILAGIPFAEVLGGSPRVSAQPGEGTNNSVELI